jgi:uncharacterized protein YdiU (UPF0061 family)
MQLPSSYRPDPAILELGEAFYDPVSPADFPQAIVRFRNDRWAEAVGLDDLNEAEWVRHFARFEPLPDNLPQPLALRYHGHQFRMYNPQIGDGRGFLYAQLRDRDDRLLDLGTKGSGQTPYSRFGDGRLTLKGAVREILATEMLEALGVRTSKTFSVIETGEPLERNDEPSPTRSAVLVRLQHSHIRIGTFQRLAYHEQADEIAALTHYCLRHYYADEDGGPGAGGRLLARFATQAARLAASYIAAGFVHGVLNTDNIAITAESFDYGPWRWTPYWDGGFTAAYFDHAGLYAFGRQPEAIGWNLKQLASCLLHNAESDELMPGLELYAPAFRDQLRLAICARLGVVPHGDEEDTALLAAIEDGLRQQAVTIDRFFFDWRGGDRRGSSPADQAYADEAFGPFRAAVKAYQPAEGATDHPYWSDAEPCSMHIEEVEAIWSSIDRNDDWSALNAKVAAIRRMGEALGQS